VPPDEEGLTASGAGRVRARLRVFLWVALAAQGVILVLQETSFLRQLFVNPSSLGAAGAMRGSSLLLVAGFLAAAWLWARRGGSGSLSGRLGAAGLANLAAVGLVAYAAGFATGRLLIAPAVATLAVSALLAAFVPRRHPVAATPFLDPRASPADAVSAVILLLLLVPTVFPYVHFDAVKIWACRASGFAARGFFGALAPCLHPEYPPLFSILLGLGAGDPLFEGRLLATLPIVFFALFVRDRFARVHVRAAPLALAFFLSVTHVWQGTAMYYANAPLMAFLSAGLLLVLGLPGAGSSATGPTRGEVVAGTLCLAAAVLVRPDGIYYLAAAVAALLLSRALGGPRLPALTLAVAVAVWGSWMLRPAFLKAPGLLSQPAGGWRVLAPGPLAAAGAVLAEFASSWQGQWLAHKGLGATLYAVVAAALADLWLGFREGTSDRGFEAEKRLYGLVTLAALAAVVACFALFPFISDPVAAVQPFEQTDWRLCYRNFVRVGLGRMTIHLLPFFVLYVLAVLRPPPGHESAANID
jgi:hypothetical protein